MNKVRSELHGPEKWFIRKESNCKNYLPEENDEELVSNSIILLGRGLGLKKMKLN